jgi:hypothetical protein
VPPGSYDLFLAAFDDEAIPHVVGYAPGTLGTGQELLFDTGRGTLMRPFNWLVDMSNNFHDNPQAAQFIDRSQLHASADAGEIGTTEFWFAEGEYPNPFQVENATPLGAGPDIQDKYSEFIGHGPGQGGGKLFRGYYDWEARKVTANEEWGADFGAVNGFIDYREVQGDRKYSSITNPEKTKVYTTNGMGSAEGTIVVWDVETGEKLKTWDVSEIFLYNRQGGERAAGPAYVGRFFDGEPDPTGLPPPRTTPQSSCAWTGTVR